MVEDDIIIALNERTSLERYGYAVIWAKTGEEAVDITRSRGDIDVILMDISLGEGIDGTEAASIILSERDIPVVFLSSHTESEITAKTAEISSYGYVPKDAGIAILDAAIRMAFRLFEEKRKVRESEERYRRLVEISPDSIFVYQGGKIVFANRACADLLGGGDAAWVIGKSPFDFVHPDYREIARNRIGNALSGDAQVPYRDIRMLRHDGSAVEVETTAIRFSTGDEEALQVIVRDVTERRRLEEDRSAALRKYKALFDSFPLGITVADRDGKIVESNATAERLLGLGAEEQARRAIDGGEWRIVRTDGTDMPTEEYASVRSLREGRIVENAEMGVMGPRGESIWLNVTAAPLADGGVVITYGDITERKRAERELRESEARFSRVFHSSPACQFITTYPDGKIVDANEAAADLLGLSREAMLGNSTLGLGVWRSPEERNDILGEIAAKGRIRQREVAFRRSGGEPVTVLISAEPIELRGETCLIATIVDVTERRRASAALRQSEERYRRLVEISPDAVFINQDDRIVYANPAMARLLGAEDASPIVGKRPLEIFHPDSYELVIARIKALRDGDEAVPTVEEKVLRLDGTSVNVEVSAIPFELEGRRAIQVIMRDISERLAAEADRHREALRTDVLLELHQTAPSLTDRELYDFIVERAATLTESAIGFFHQVSDDQNDIILTTWNRAALAGCTAGGGDHYPLASAGNWVDCVREKRPVVYNDFANSPNQKGLPQGHVSLRRFMSIPVIEDGKVRIIFGVGNKESDYDDNDVSHLQLVANELHRIMTQRSAREKVRLQASLLDQIGDLVVATDLVGVVTYANGAQSRAAGIPAAELEGRPLEALGGILGADGNEAMETTLVRGSWHGEVITRNSDGAETAMDVRTASVLGDTGAPVGIIIARTDVTARKAAETGLENERRDLARRVEERTAELRGATAAAEAANRAKSDFLASMSHELRTPLNSIIGFSEVMMGGLTGELTDEQKEYLGDIHASGKHLLSLINDILDLSKVEAGKMELQASDVNVRELVRATVALFRERALKHGIALRIDLPSGAGDGALTADERKLKQVLFNLVSNAIKFTPEGGTVEIGVATAPEGERSFVVFRVSDTGIGIALADRDRLFRPFSQIDGSSTRSYGGTGLGLSICKSFVELHGGSIWLESEEGKGSSFFFSIPSASSGNGEG